MMTTQFRPKADNTAGGDHIEEIRSELDDDRSHRITR